YINSKLVFDKKPKKRILKRIFSYEWSYPFPVKWFGCAAHCLPTARCACGTLRLCLVGGVGAGDCECHYQTHIGSAYHSHHFCYARVVSAGDQRAYDYAGRLAGGWLYGRWFLVGAVVQFDPVVV